MMKNDTDTKLSRQKPPGAARTPEGGPTVLQRLAADLRAAGEPFMMLGPPGSSLQLPAHMLDLQPANEDRAERP